MKKNKYFIILLFGVFLAGMTLLLQVLEFKYLVGHLDTQVYTSLIAILFTGMGVWIGYNLIKPKKKIVLPKGQINQKALKKLHLNQREYEVLNLIAQGLTNQEIADTLFLALPTIKTHTSNLYSKLDVKNRTQAVHKARELQIIL